MRYSKKLYLLPKYGSRLRCEHTGASPVHNRHYHNYNFRTPPRKYHQKFTLHQCCHSWEYILLLKASEMATIDHYPPEENYGGEYYSSSDEQDSEVEEEEEIYEEEEILEEEYVPDEDRWAEGDEVIVCEDEYEEYEYHYDDGPGAVLDDTGPAAAAGGGMAAMIAAAARNRAEKRAGDCGPRYAASGGTAATSVATSEDDYELDCSLEEDEEGDAPAAGGGMAAMIAAAASRRNQRIDGGGEVKIREVAPAPEATPDAQGFAAMAAAAASKRKDRIEAGGELVIREVREIPEEHRNVFVTIAEEAANVGRLVRLNEVVVEAESRKSNEKVDTWSGPGGLLLDFQRSNFIRAVNEAAAMGRLRRLKPTETTNYDTALDYEEEQRIDIEKQVDQYGRRALRTQFLLDEHIREESKEKRELWAPENFDAPFTYRSIDEVELPTEKLPAFKPKKANFMSQRDALEAISSAVAASAWERNYRLQRPKAQLKVTRGCACPYCKNPNPFQTHKYKKLYVEEVRDVENSDRPSESTTDEQVSEKETTEIPFYLKPPEGKIYQPTKPEAEKKWAEDLEYNKRKVSDAPKTVKKWQPPKQSSVPATFQGGTKPAPKPYQRRPSADRNRTVLLEPTPAQIGDGDTCEPVPPSSATHAYSSTIQDSNGGYYSASKTGTKVLLDETIDFGTRHKKVHIKKEKPAKEKKKGKSKKSKKSEKADGCAIM